MKKSLKRVLIASAVMVSVLSAGILASCSAGADLESKKKKEGYSYTVTYDANGGSFGSNSTRTYTLVKENSLTPAPGYVDGKTQASVKVPTRRNYQLWEEAASDNDEDTNDEAILTRSWFVAKTDEKGNVIYEGEGDNLTPVLLSSEPWNFTKDRVTEDITLVAMWREVFRFSLCISETNDEGAITEKEVRSYTVNVGDSIVDKLYKKQDGEIVRRADYISVKQSGYTLLDFYLDDAYTTYLATDYVHPGSRDVEETQIDPETGEEMQVTVQTNTVKIYAKYLSGKYDLITNENKKLLTETSKWYFLEDIDCTDVTWEAVGSFKGEIFGNGYTLKNVTVTSLATRATSYKAHSIFGKFEGTVENLTLENVTMQVYTNYGAKVIGEQRVNFLAYEFTEAGSMTNVTLKDCKLSLKVLDDNNEPTLFEGHIGDNGGLWWVVPAETQIIGVVVKENDEVVNAIKVVQE